MADRLLMCDRCPLRLEVLRTRAQADLLADLGHEERAEELRRAATQAEEAGCSWWWPASEGFRGQATPEHPHGEILEGCGEVLLPKLLASNAQAMSGQAAAAETHRNAVLRLVMAPDRQGLENAVERFLSEEVRRLLDDRTAPRQVGAGADEGDRR